MNRIIAIPSNGPDISNYISEHFGHCDYFVGIEIDNFGSFKKAFSLQNHGHLGCMEPVINMVKRNVKDMIVSGIGGRPYMGFIQYNLRLHKGINGTSKENIENLIQGKLKPLTGPMCRGH